jgi:hypothetical protein
MILTTKNWIFLEKWNNNVPASTKIHNLHIIINLQKKLDIFVTY